MSTHIPHLDVGSGRQQGALTLFPVWSGAPTIHGLRWSTRKLEVGELPDGATVSRLHVGNPSAKPAVLLEGDLLVGGMQHRMAALSTVVPARDAMAIEVLCVEQGRWSGARTHRPTDGRGSYAVRQRSLAGRERGTAQDEAWRRVGVYDNCFGESSTRSMLDHLDGVAAEPMQIMPGQRGVIVGIGGRVIGMELFGSSRGLRARWDGLVRAAQLDARMASPVRTTSHDARTFVRTLGRADIRDVGAAGIARAIRADGPLTVTGMQAQDRSLLHLAAFDDAHPLLAAV